MYRAIWHTFQPQRSTFFSKKYSYSFPQRTLISKKFSYSQESNPALSDLSPQTFFPKIIFIYFNEKDCFENISYIFSKRAFLISRKQNFLIFSIKKFFVYFGKGIFRTLAWRNFYYISGKEYSESWHNRTFLYFWNYGFLALYFSHIPGSNFWSSKNEKTFYILRNGTFNSLKSSYITFQTYAQKKKVSHTFLYKEANFSKLKYFLIIKIVCLIL